MQIYRKDDMIVGTTVVGAVLFVRTAIRQKDKGPIVDLLMVHNGTVRHIVPEKWDDNPAQVALGDLDAKLAEAAYNLEMTCASVCEAHVG